MESIQDLKQGERGAWISIIAYVFLSLLKIIISYIGHSEALLADGLNNSTDVVASIAVLIGLKISQKPPDDDHHYGHYRAETIASLIAAFIMATVGLQVIVEAFKGIFNPEKVIPDMITAWTAIFSAGVMFFVYLNNIKLSKKIDSLALKSAASDNLSDALVSIGAFVGIIGANLGIPVLDTIAAFVVGIIIMKTAWNIFYTATHSLTDGFDTKELEKIKENIKNITGVQLIKDIKARTHGSNALVDITICVDPYLNVIDSHKITEEIEVNLKKKHKIKHIHIHIEPVNDKEE